MFGIRDASQVESSAHSQIFRWSWVFQDREMLAKRFRKQKLQWDEAAMKFTGHDDANNWLRRDDRDGWDIEAVT